MFAFGPLNSPLWNQTPKRKTLVAQGRVKLCDPLCVEWNSNGDGDPDLPSGDGNYRCGGE